MQRLIQTASFDVPTPRLTNLHRIAEPLQRRNIVRDLFLDFFGAALTQRAESFSAALSEGGAGERAEVTIHQLRRYFGLCGSPSMAKVSSRHGNTVNSIVRTLVLCRSRHTIASMSIDEKRF